MASNDRKIIVIHSEAEFNSKLANAGSRLVVVDFMASWCGPCNAIAPTFASLSHKYQAAVFMKVDVDECKSLAESQGIRNMPTFRLFKNQTKVAEVIGADAAPLEAAILQFVGEEEKEVSIDGHFDLLQVISSSLCECLNLSDDSKLSNVLEPNDSFIESDCDEQLLITIGFTQTVKLHSLSISAEDTAFAPKTIKIFINQPRSLDFDSAESNKPLQELKLEPQQVMQDAIVGLQYVKYQSVNSITLFVSDNQGGKETTRINMLRLFGTPRDFTNMKEFKRVAGKAGESH